MAFQLPVSWGDAGRVRHDRLAVLYHPRGAECGHRSDGVPFLPRPTGATPEEIGEIFLRSKSVLDPQRVALKEFRMHLSEAVDVEGGGL
ncbi:hypothetical protein BJX96DRAFT_157382 [Aspergillus floccosus]